MLMKENLFLRPAETELHNGSRRCSKRSMVNEATIPR